MNPRLWRGLCSGLTSSDLGLHQHCPPVPSSWENVTSRLELHSPAITVCLSWSLLDPCCLFLLSYHCQWDLGMLQGAQALLLHILIGTCLGFPHSSVGKESVCNVGDLGSIPGLRRSPAEGNGNPLQYSCLENPMDRGACPWGSQRDGHGLATKSPPPQLLRLSFSLVSHFLILLEYIIPSSFSWSQFKSTFLEIAFPSSFWRFESWPHI